MSIQTKINELTKQKTELEVSIMHLQALDTKLKEIEKDALYKGNPFIEKGSLAYKGLQYLTREI